MAYNKDFLKQDIWQPSKDLELESYPMLDTTGLYYERARSIVLAEAFTADDILNLTPKFWDFYLKLIAVRDTATLTIVAIHLNLCLGSLIPFAKETPELSTLVEKLLKFEVNGQFMLSEVAHGLDARNLETTATMLPDGTFDLHTPHSGAAKSMPLNTTASGIPRVAVLFARLIVQGEDHGVKTFLVWLSESGKLNPGITSRLLPARPGSKQLDHGITTFHHVKLPRSALLGSPKKPSDERIEFMRRIWRVPIGTLSLSMACVPGIRTATFVAAAYSLRRRVGSETDGGPVPIMSFSTQYRPIVDGYVQAEILEAYAKWTVKKFMEPATPLLVRSALGAIFKATAIQSWRVSAELAERCGWQGLYSFNQIAQLTLASRGNAIAEGDILVLCIRLASEILGNKYSLPKATDPSGLLARRESQAMAEANTTLAEIGGYGVHRGPAFNRYILPRSRPLIEAVGHRMAYEAAKEAGISHKILRIYEAQCVGSTPSSVVETMDQNALADLYEEFLMEIMPQFEDSEVADYLTAPIVSDESWDAFFESLPTKTANWRAKL